MPGVAIIGAGELGGATAHLLARRDVVRSITLVDDKGRVAAGKALDIAEAAPIEGFATRLSGSHDVSGAAGAAIVVLADRVDGGEWQGEEGLLLLKRLTQMASAAVILCAGSAQRELVDRGVGNRHFTRARLFGSAPEALAGGARALVALAVNGSPADVALTVLGVPPDHTVIPWADATVAGFALTRLVDEPSRRRIGARVARLWPPGPYSLAAAAVKVIEAISGGSRRMASCFVAPDPDQAGARTRTGAMPVTLDAAGIANILLPALSANERVAFDNAMQL